MTLSYPEVGATAGDLPLGYQHLYAAREVGTGRDLFERCAETVMTWGVQRGAGLLVVPGTRVTEGAENRIGLRLGPLRTWAPCRVVYVVDELDRRGFAYGTLTGHPERGEESFVVSIDEQDVVLFEVTAFSRPDRWFARLGGPVTRLVQRHVTWRYLEAVHPAHGP
ncbi:MAG TPA: DUF1990 domain-containing protein [Mycobacteriales bacterium]|nr:DUF1990 domain-containing protein [Mycobacteriales bacterium]